MDVRYFTMAKLIFLVMWTTVCGPLSGFTMGLFFLVYQDGYRRGVLPPQGGKTLAELLTIPTFLRLGGDHRQS